MPRPYWSGQIRISLVAFGVKLFPAIEAKSEIHFHQISRSSGERVRHQKVSESDAEPVENDEIVKGYEYSKGQYIHIEPEEINNLRIPSRESIEVEHCVNLSELDPALFEKPYFLVPENDAQAEAFAVIRKALQQTNKAALGKFATGGREHLVAITAPSDDKLPGMMAYTLRYAEELRNAASYFSEIKKVTVDADQLALAKDLIKRKSNKFPIEKYKDEYETALRELVEAKLKHVEIPKEKPSRSTGKVVDLMDALRRSVTAGSSEITKPKKKPSDRASSREVRSRATKHGIKLVQKKSMKEKSTRRKSA